jgi:hypothetical protein
MVGFIKFSPFLSDLWPNLDNSSCGWLLVWLHCKIETKKTLMLLNTKCTSLRINKGETKWFLINKQRCKINCIDAITLHSSIVVYPNLKIWSYSSWKVFLWAKMSKGQGLPPRYSYKRKLMKKKQL